MQKPYSVQFGRASDIQIIATLYDSVTPAFGMPSTLRYIMDDIFKNGREPFYVDRWMNLLGFTYSNGNFSTYEGVALPMPNSQRFIEAINDFIDGHNNYYPGEPDVQDITTITALNQVIIPQTPLHGQLTVTDFIKQAVWNCFVPLTEIPVIYQHIKDNNYTPQPKKQVVRDRNGNLLSPSQPDFDMAPMMKVTSASEYRIQFTDFGLDGASSVRYFYAAKEIKLQMRTSIYSPILGPISMVNSSAPPSPDIVKVLSVLENRQLGTLPAIQFTINAYPQAQGIVKINIYRTLQKADALSVRTMPLVKEIEIDGDMADARVWTIYDDFDDLPFVPFGDTLYYRLTVSREIKYNTPSGSLVTDYAPSSTSELMVTNVVNNVMPDSPVLSYYSEPESNGQLNSVILSWEATVYNGKYHVYKMNTQGNWVKLQEVVSNAEILYLPVGNLTIEDTNGNPLYHHYKVLAENYSGMISTNENMLTIYQADTWQDIGGIGDMIIEGTFIVR